MERILMKKVGDALNMYISEGLDKPMLMVDFGFENINTFNSVFCAGKQQLCDVFLLSHYHADHYNGFCFLYPQSIFCFNKIILPRFPKYVANSTNVISLFVLSALITNNLFLNILQLICSSSKNQSPIIQLVSKGDTFNYNNHTYEVLWPPRNNVDVTLTKSVNKLLKKWEQLKEVDSDLSKIYDKINNFKFNDESDFLSNVSNDDFDQLDRCLENYYKKEINKEEEKLIFDFNQALREVANRLSIAFNQEDKVLFLGDLMPNELNIVTNDLIAKEHVKYDLIVAAHHGTHWGRQMVNLKSKCCLISVGRHLNKSVKSNLYRSISDRVFKTVDCGEINLYLNDKLKL